MKKELRIWLVANDLTVAEIARQLGVSRQYLHHLLHNRRPGHSTRQRIVREFGCPPDLVRYSPPVPATRAA